MNGLYKSGFPKILSYKQCSDKYEILLESLGEDLNLFFQTKPRSCTLLMSYNICLQILDRLE